MHKYNLGIIDMPPNRLLEVLGQDDFVIDTVIKYCKIVDFINII